VILTVLEGLVLVAEVVFVVVVVVFALGWQIFKTAL
jgi:hypothetical protein